MESINELAVIVTALLAIALGSIWYSPLVFGTHWQRATGLMKDAFTLTTRQLITALVSAFIANVLVLTIIAYAIALSEEFGISRLYLALGLTVFIGASLGSMVVWERRSWVYFAIHAGYAATVIFFGILIIAYWPW
jgi:hypothetical protein